jgi:subtilisin family serine protease
LPTPGPRRARLIALGSALALLTAVPPSLAAASATATAATNTPDAAGTRPGTQNNVTLITGDTVTVTTAPGGIEPEAVKGPHGEAVDFEIARSGKDIFVYPDSALPYVSSGLLDKDLFNVTQLVADGYDDAHSDHLPLIVNYTDAAAHERARTVPSGASQVRALDSIQGAALSERRDHATDFWSALTTGAGARATGTRRAFSGGIAKVWLDGKVKADLADTTAQIGAPEVWAKGNTGAGVDVAVLDSGVDNGHPDLTGRIAGSASFVPDENVFEDVIGHGTHVASTIAGTGAASGGKEKGVAPGARLHIGKVLGTACDIGGCHGVGQESWILAGMEWAAVDQHAKIVNLSLGSGPSDGTDPMSQAVDRLSAETGALFVVAAGNSGAPGTVAAPGAADAALTVGAVDGSDQLAGFSSQGPRVGDDGLKPEITAPGVDVLAAHSHLADGEGDYQTMSGTSMAAPHVAGAAALLAAAHPDWTGRQLKDALISSSKATPQYTPYQAGAGRVDAAAAVRDTVFATGSAYAGYHRWPHRAGEKDVTEVTYTNTAGAPVTLDLAIDVPDAPKGLFTLSTTHVTVPAHGTSKVSYTTDMDKAPLGSNYSGMITASAGGKVLAHTLVGTGKEAERYDLSITAKDRSGEPLGGELTVTGKGVYDIFQLDASGKATLRMPPGTYAVWLKADVEGTHGPHSMGKALLSAPEIDLDRDRAVMLDARAARQVSAVVPQATTDSEFHMDLDRVFGADEYAISTLDLSAYEYDSMWALPTGKKVTKGQFSFSARWRKEEPALTVASGTQDFDDLRVQRGSAQLPDGRTTLDAVFAGQGAASDYTGLPARGKVAVVRRNDAVSPEDQAAAAVQAGARLLLVVNDGMGRLRPWPVGLQSFGTTPPLPVATLTQDEGEQLIARIQHGRTPLTLVSSRTTDYLYDLVHTYSGAVPADPVYRPSKDDLARVDVSFRNYRQDRTVEYRSDVIFLGIELGYSYLHETPAQGERTDWVSAGKDIRWIERNQIPGEIQEAGPTVSYEAGTTSHLDWFGPIERPRLDNERGTQQRFEDEMSVAVPGWGDSGGAHVGGTVDNPLVSNIVSLYQGDSLLAQNYGDFLDAGGLSPERLPYRLVSENSRGGWTNPYSTSTRTEWDFTSAHAEPGVPAVLPLIQLDYQVDTDLAGKARRNAELVVTPSHLPGGPSSAAIRTVTVDVSYDDGTTWHKATLTRRGAGWETRLHAPADASYATLRASAHDDQGDSVTQSITRAFGLK